MKPESISRITCGFSEENYIGNFQFGKVYRGIFKTKEVTVKVWEDHNPSGLYKLRPGDNESRLKDELTLQDIFAEDPWLSHPNVANLIGCCEDSGHLAAVYDLKPLNTVHNLIQKDSFTWPQRIKVALGFASVLEFMHAWRPPYFPTLPYLIRNVDAAHIMLDQDYNPMLFDFSMISGGLLFDRRNLLNQYLDGCFGYADPVCASKGEWSDKCDVFSYGVLLLALISKRVHVKENDLDTPFLYEWAESEYKRQKSMRCIGKSYATLVHQSLESGPHFYSTDGTKITKIAMRCVSYDPRKRPTMKQVVKYLRNLLVVRHHAATIDVDWTRRAVGCKSTKKDKHRAGYLKIMLKKSDFQILLWSLKNKKKIPQQCKLLLEWCWQYFSESIHRRLPLFKDHGGPNFCLAGKGSSGKEFHSIKVFSYEDLTLFTNGFSRKNFIDNFQFGRVFHGKVEARQVTVKIWEIPEWYRVKPGDNGSRLRDELVLLQHPKLISHPNMVKLIGYCHEGEQLGVVYDLEPLDTVYNLVWQDCFTWLQRIKVAFGFACLLKFLHAGEVRLMPYLVRNISAFHIMLEQDYNPKLFDFGMFSGGILPDRRFEKHQYVHGCHGYLAYDCGLPGGLSEKSDVYAYGTVLLSLISKRIYREDMKDVMPDMNEWAKSEYRAKLSMAGSGQCSLVHKSLEGERGFYSSDGLEITKLAMDCVADDSCNRPTMKQVVKGLLNLFAVRRHADDLGIKQMLRC